MPSNSNREPSTTEPATAFADRLLAWFDVHGRKDLPWQLDRDPYRIWVSEVMLQQTQVATVIPYFQRFVEHFPTLAHLAAADHDAVMALWAGLGYYSRARNLKRSAEICMVEHDARLPIDFDALLALPGIGRSTAGAILAQAHGQRHAILDGNVKRVLARFHALEGWPGQSAVQHKLWTLAEQYTPATRIADYTQAIMDLGATLCQPRLAQCGSCPLADDCRAAALGKQAEFPTPRPRKALPERERFVLLITRGDRVLVERRPPSGIWGGLHSLPMAEAHDAIDEAVAFGPVIRHAFTHFRLSLTPVLFDHAPAAGINDNEHRWISSDDMKRIGLPGPIATLLNKHFQGRIQWQEPFTA